MDLYESWYVITLGDHPEWDEYVAKRSLLLKKKFLKVL